MKNSAYYSNLVNNSYIGEIVDANDPDFKGRCRIMVFGVYGNKEDKKIPIEDIPWAYPIYSNSFAGGNGGNGAFSTPKKGTMVRVIFDRDKYHPKYVGIEELDAILKNTLKDDYDGFHSVIWDNDEKLKIYYSKKGGLLIYFDGGKINMSPNGNILIDHKNSTSTIELSDNNIDIVTNSTANVSSTNQVTLNSALVHANGDKTDIGSNPIYSAVNGEVAYQLFLVLATSIDAKLNVTPGLNANIVTSLKNSLLSGTVKTSP